MHMFIGSTSDPFLLVKSFAYFTLLQIAGVFVLVLEFFRFVGVLDLLNSIREDLGDAEPPWSVMNSGKHIM